MCNAFSLELRCCFLSDYIKKGSSYMPRKNQLFYESLITKNCGCSKDVLVQISVKCNNNDCQNILKSCEGVRIINEALFSYYGMKDILKPMIPQSIKVL